MAAQILVIEDHAANLDLVTYLLTAYGYTVLQAADGRGGMEIAMREQPDLIICDIQLPDISGYEIAAQLKRDDRLRQKPIVAITALAMVGDRERVLLAGFDGYISKPIAPETFVADVANFLGGAKPAPKEQPATVPNGPLEAQPPVSGAQRATILAVDNVPSNLDLARSIFEPSGYRVLLADDVEEAMAIARETRPDVVLSDVNMPEGSGLELVLRMKSDPQLSDVPVVLISATLPRDTRDDLVVAAGATKFLRRPIDPDVLLQEIENCLEQSRRAHA